MSDERKEANAKIRLRDLVERAKIGMLTTRDGHGQLVSRPMGMQQSEFDGTLWFFTYDTSNKAKEIKVDPSVNVSFSDQKSHSWTSIAGTAEVLFDRGVAEDLWNPMLRAWFPDGLETKGLSLIKITAVSAEYWDTPESSVKSVLHIVSSAVGGKPASDLGENREVKL